MVFSFGVEPTKVSTIDLLETKTAFLSLLSPEKIFVSEVVSWMNGKEGGSTGKRNSMRILIDQLLEDFDERF